MKHLDKFTEFVEANEEQLSLFIQLRDAYEYKKCSYYIAEVSQGFYNYVIIRKSDKKQISKGSASDLKKYIKKNNIPLEDIFDLKKIGVNVDKPGLAKFNELIERGKESLELSKKLKKAWMIENMLYMVVKDKYLHNKFALIDLKTNYYVVKCDTAVQILKHIDRLGIKPEDVYDYELIKKKS